MLTAAENTVASDILDSLDVAGREYAAGNHRESSRILWEATRATFELMARVRGMNTSDLLEITRALDEERHRKDIRRRHSYSGKLMSAGLLRDHAEMGVLEDYQMELPHKYLPAFIRRQMRELDANGAD
ncbi:MAG: hypothetical protein F4Z35_09295 [Dehalococcoidia bacterium]|nr:hypothetical protein [Dehalococcoidia bacterium]